MTYEMIRRNFDRKLWNANMVKMAVVKGVITVEDFEEITGKAYIA